MSNYKFKINGKPYEVSVNGVADGIADVTVNGIDYQVEIENAPTTAASTPAVGGGVPPETNATLGIRGGTMSEANGGAKRSEAVSGGSSTSNPTSGKKITSPLPGVVIDVCVSEGQAVKKGQKIVVLEAMKMENEILAESDGTVAGLYVKKGDSVLEGADIASIA